MSVPLSLQPVLRVSVSVCLSVRLVFVCGCVIVHESVSNDVGARVCPVCVCVVCDACVRPASSWLRVGSFVRSFGVSGVLLI